MKKKEEIICVGTTLYKIVNQPRIGGLYGTEYKKQADEEMRKGNVIG